MVLNRLMDTVSQRHGNEEIRGLILGQAPQPLSSCLLVRSLATCAKVNGHPLVGAHPSTEPIMFLHLD